MDSSQYAAFAADLRFPPPGEKVCCGVSRVQNGKDIAATSQVYEYLRDIRNAEIHTLCHLPLEMNRVILICHTDQCAKGLLTFIKKSFDDFTHEVTSVLESMNTAPPQPAAEHKENALISDILEHLNDEFSNPDLSIQSLAEEFHMSPSNICQYFHLQTGTTILTYITQLRMQSACELLKNTKDTIESIAEKTGYQNVSSFTRRFKKEIGIPPGAYRKLH